MNEAFKQQLIQLDLKVSRVRERRVWKRLSCTGFPRQLRFEVEHNCVVGVSLVYTIGHGIGAVVKFSARLDSNDHFWLKFLPSPLLHYGAIRIQHFGKIDFFFFTFSYRPGLKNTPVKDFIKIRGYNVTRNFSRFVESEATRRKYRCYGEKKSKKRGETRSQRYKNSVTFTRHVERVSFSRPCFSRWF